MSTAPAAPASPAGAGAPFPAGGTAGYRPGRTLRLRVEARRQLRRRRTIIVFGLLVALPFILMAAFAIGGTPSEGSNGPTLIDTATASGANFAATCLFVSAGFVLVVPVALFCGDTVASEAGWSSLRYLLAAPVPRTRLLSVKFTVALAFSAVAILVLPAVALLAGTVAYGWGGLQLPAGGELASGHAVPRMVIAVVYIMVSQLVTAALAFWLSTITDAPLGAVGGAVGLTIVGNVLDAVTALKSYRDVLPAHWQFSWLDSVQPTMEWSGMLQGTSVSVSYALVFTALAFRGFRTKDIVS
ncbi:ABC transporter permease [Streptomyces sp. CA-111067]|jgi:ABC-2 type transport system permease protein|uniref:ABC transporter permease n=1 Tax=Streptomyces sp. CA-111067 TaxID=3240046 RepID=UPI003D98AAA5